MNIMMEPYGRQSVYQDLRGYKLEGTQYRWKFDVVPMYGNTHQIKAMLKKRGVFKPSVMKGAVVVDIQHDDVISILKQSMSAMLETEHAQKAVSSHSE